MVIIALAVVVLIQTVGLALVMALFTLPAATVLLFARSVARLMLGATLLSAAVIAAGLGVSFETDSPAGATIVLCAAVFFVAALLWKRSLRRF